MVNINGEVTDTIMGQTVPTDSTPGPLYAADIASNLLYHVAPHTHTGVNNLDGYQLGADSLDITSDINFNTTNLNSVRSSRYTSQSSTLVGSQDLNSLYVVNGNLFYNNQDGYAVQITTNNTIVDVSNFLTTLTGVFINNPVTPFVIPSNATYNLLNISSTTNAVTITLPISSTVPAGRFYFFQDVGGNAAVDNILIQVTSGSGNEIYYSSNAGATSFLLVDRNIGGYIYTNGTGAWYIQTFSTLTYNTETITFANTSTLNFTGNSNFNFTGNLFSINSPATLASNVTLTAGNSLSVALNAELDGYGSAFFRSGSNTQFLSGSALTLNNGMTFVIDAAVTSNNTFTSNGNIVASNAVAIGGPLTVNGGVTSATTPFFWSNPGVVNILGGGTNSTTLASATFTSGSYNSPIIRVTRSNGITGIWTFIFPTYPAVPDGTTWMLDLSACMVNGVDTGSIEIVVGSLPNVIVYNGYTNPPAFIFKSMFIVQVNKDAIITVCG